MEGMTASTAAENMRPLVHASDDLLSYDYHARPNEINTAGDADA